MLRVQAPFWGLQIILDNFLAIEFFTLYFKPKMEKQMDNVDLKNGKLGKGS